MKNIFSVILLLFFLFSCADYQVPIKPNRLGGEINKTKAAIKFVEMVAETSPPLERKIQKIKKIRDKWMHFEGKIKKGKDEKSSNKNEKGGFAIKYEAKFSSKVEVEISKKISKNSELSLKGKGGLQKQRIEFLFQWSF